MKTKALNFFSAIKYQLITFVLLAGQAIYTLLSYSHFKVGKTITLYYLVDLSMLKSSRTWVGTLVSLLTDHPSWEWINGFAAVILFIAIFITAFLVGKVIKNVENEIRPQAFIAALFLVTGSFTLHFFSRNFGFLDTHLFIIALVAVVFLNNKILRWFVPVLCVAGFFTHQLFVTMYFPMIAFVALYLIVVQKGGRISKSAVLMLSIIVLLFVAIWVLAKGHKTSVYTPEQMLEIIQSKIGLEYEKEIVDEMRWEYFYIPPPSAGNYSYEEVAALTLKDYIVGWLNYTNNIKGFSFDYFLALSSATGIVFAAFSAIWIMCIRNTESKLKKFVFACFLITVLTASIGCFVNFDFERMFQAAVLCQFVFLFFMFYVKDEAFNKTMAQLGEFFKDKKILLVIAFAVYNMAIL